MGTKKNLKVNCKGNCASERGYHKVFDTNKEITKVVKLFAILSEK